MADLQNLWAVRTVINLGYTRMIVARTGNLDGLTTHYFYSIV